MAQDNDGVDDLMDGSIRVALTLAGQLGERLAREREQAAREARAASDTEARETQARLAAERAAARAQLAPLKHDAWWEKANAQQITDALQVAVTWQAVDPQAAAAVAVIRHQVQQRYGVDVEDLPADPRRMSEAASENGTSTTRAGGEAERVEAGRVLAATDRDQDPDSTTERGEPATQVAPAYDSRERRHEHAARLAEQGRDPELIQAVMSADVSQARPERDAVAAAPTSTSASPAQGQRGSQAELGR